MRYLIGALERERAMQARLLRDLNAKFARPIAEEIESATLDMMAEYERTGSIPPLPLQHSASLAEIYSHMAALSIQAFGERILDQGKAAGLVLETKGFAELFYRLASEYIGLEAIRRRIAQVSETTRRHIIGAISRGQDQGKPLPEIVKDIRASVPEISKTRAHIITRTETHGAANYGANEAAKATGLKLKKEWVSVEDHRTRDFGEADGEVDEYNHRIMAGVIVDMDQPFMVPVKGGANEPLMYPGDVNGSAGNIINCRCQIAHIVDDDL